MISMNANKNITARPGIALLAVLMIVMVITVMALGFLSRSDVELACGENMVMRTQMDYLAESGLEHARGLILNPQDVAGEYWVGATAQQLAAGSADYYDLVVTRDNTDRCNYTIDCDSYRLSGGERSNLRATLRLDPCVALWTDKDAILWSGFEVYGDVYCNGALENENAEVIDGDVFADTLSGSISGRHETTGALSLTWPRVTVLDFTSNYPTQPIGSASLSGQTLGPYDPVRVCYRIGNLTLAGNVQIEGMLVVDGDLVLRGGGNRITAAKNLPALLVIGDLVIEDNGVLDVNGLAVINGDMQISADTADVDIVGGLFVGGKIVQTAVDETGNNTGILLNDPVWRPGSGPVGGALEFNGDDTAVEINSLDVSGTALTMSAWINADRFDHLASQDARIISKAVGLADQDHYWMLSTIATDGQTRLRFHLKAGGSTTVLIADTGSLTTGTWIHVAAVYDGSDMKLYMGSLEVGSIAKTGAIDTNSGVPTWIGGNPSGVSDRPFDGLIADVRIYDRVLDADDLPPSDGSGLVAHWGLDEIGSNVTITAAPSRTAIMTWSATGDAEKWGQAGGAFFRSVERR